MTKTARAIGACPTCGAKWTATAVAHCTVCHQTFSTDAVADRHRRGKHGVNRVCVHPVFLGLIYDEERQLWKSPPPKDPTVWAKRQGTPQA